MNQAIFSEIQFMERKKNLYVETNIDNKKKINPKTKLDRKNIIGYPI